MKNTSIPKAIVQYFEKNSITRCHFIDIDMIDANNGTSTRYNISRETKCLMHPKYKAVYKPRVNCKACQKIYDIQQMELV